MKAKRNFAGNKYNKYGWAFISLAVLAFIMFTVYPIISSLDLSFKVLRQGDYVFGGITNIKRLAGDKLFHRTIGNTFIFLVVQGPVMLVFALIFASTLNTKIRFRTLYRTALFVPCVMSLVSYSVLFKMMFATNGIINNFLIWLKLVKEPIFFINDPFWARVVIIIAMTWRWTGYNMMFYLAAMQNIPNETYEAARVDGAGPIILFFKITLPQLKPIILLTMIMTTNGNLQLFDEPMNLTGGGPAEMTTTMSQYIYNTAFVYSPSFGYAVMMSYVIVIMVGFLALIQFKVVKD
jgi:lactose/L-arabinose transport system permease protein